jgi:hypothetical protein
MSKGIAVFGILVWMFFASLYVGAFGAVIWVAWHFIKKLW